MPNSEHCEKRKSHWEIEEIKFINYNGKVRWMLCMDDKGPKDVRVFFVDNNGIIEHFLPIIKDNIYTYYIHIENKVDINPENPAKRIYSDSL